MSVIKSNEATFNVRKYPGILPAGCTDPGILPIGSRDPHRISCGETSGRDSVKCQRIKRYRGGSQAYIAIHIKAGLKTWGVPGVGYRTMGQGI